jgi:alkylhydroperoxidase/carboxymuconolactone decarboxylase family protein YurZ
MSGSNRDDRLIVGGVPRAELLPPELKAEGQLRSQRRGLITIAILIVGLVVAAYGLVAFLGQGTQTLIDATNQQSAELIAQEANYFEVRQLAAQVTAAENAQKVGESTDVDWTAILYSIDDSMPQGMTLKTIQITVPTPDSPFLASAVPLDGPRVTELKIQTETAKYSLVSPWIRNLQQVLGYSDATISTIEFNKDAGKLLVTTTLHLNDTVFTHRFEQDGTASK